MISREKLWEWELEEKFNIYERVDRLHSWRLVEDEARRLSIIQNAVSPPACYATNAKTMWLAVLENNKIKFYRAKRVK